LTDIGATRGLDGLNDGFDEAEKHANLFRAEIDQLIKLDQDNVKSIPADQTGLRGLLQSG